MWICTAVLSAATPRQVLWPLDRHKGGAVWTLSILIHAQGNPALLDAVVVLYVGENYIMSACLDLWWMTESDINRCKYLIWAVIGVGWLETHTAQAYTVKKFKCNTPQTDRHTQVFSQASSRFWLVVLTISSLWSSKFLRNEENSCKDSSKKREKKKIKHGNKYNHSATLSLTLTLSRAAWKTLWLSLVPTTGAHQKLLLICW